MVKCPVKSIVFASLSLIVVTCLGVVYFTGGYTFPFQDNYLYVALSASQIKFTTDERFLSVALDTSFMRCLFHKLNDSEWQKLEELSSLFVPAYLRLGGTQADEVLFSLDDDLISTNENSSGCIDNPSPGDSLIITGSDWIKINNFVNNSGLNFIFDLNVLLRTESDEWNSSNTETLIKFSEENGFLMDFQLGNEPNSFRHVFNVSLSGKQLAKDFDKLKNILKNTKSYKTSKLIGPDVTRPKNLNKPSLEYLKQFLSETSNFDVASWHQYYLNGRTATLDDFINPDTFDLLPIQIESVTKVVRQFSMNVPIWISETGSAYGGGAPGLSDRYAAAFLWLDKLGVSAKSGINVVIRQSLFQSSYALINPDFTPSPDFWISFFYKNLVGNKVLDLRYGGSTENAKYLRLYSHCLSSKSTLNGTSIIYGMNLGKQNKEIVTTGIAITYPIYSFTFTPESNDLTSKRIRLNGEKLIYDRNTIYELLEKPEKAVLPLIARPHSIFFWIIHELTDTVCAKRSKG